MALEEADDPIAVAVGIAVEDRDMARALREPELRWVAGGGKQPLGVGVGDDGVRRPVEMAFNGKEPIADTQGDVEEPSAPVDRVRGTGLRLREPDGRVPPPV